MNAVTGRVDLVGLADDLPARFLEPALDGIRCILPQLTFVVGIARFDMQHGNAPCVLHIIVDAHVISKRATRSPKMPPETHEPS